MFRIPRHLARLVVVVFFRPRWADVGVGDDVVVAEAAAEGGPETHFFWDVGFCFGGGREVLVGFGWRWFGVLDWVGFRVCVCVCGGCVGGLSDLMCDLVIKGITRREGRGEGGL